MRRALVIGSEGNIGRPLVRHLATSGWEVMAADIKPAWRPGYLQADINNPFDLLPTLRWKPDVIFALAAIVSRVTCEQASSLAVATNLGGLNNMLLIARETGAKFVYFSTSEVYGPDAEFMDEATTTPRPNNRYGLCKLLGEQLVEYDVRHAGLRAVSLRPFMIYDEHEDFGDHRSAMIRFAHNLARGIPIEVHDGSARGWLHVSDAVRAIERAADVSEYMAINIGHPDVIPIAELAERIRRRLGAEPDLVRRRTLPGQMTAVKRPNLERMDTLLRAAPTVALNEGIERLCATTRERVGNLAMAGAS